MSRWLANVNSMLEKLDGTVEDAIEDQRDEDVDNLDSILAKRGLSEQLETEAASQQHFEDDADGEEADFVTEEEQKDDEQEDQSEEHSSVVVLESEGSEEYNSTDEVVVVVDAETDQPEELTATEEADEMETDEKAQGDDTTTTDDKTESLETEQEDQLLVTPVKKKQHVHIPRTPQGHITSLAPPAPSSTISNQEKQSIADAREAQKEARTLRRHVVSLNKQLETAELELEAQRSELEQAGERLEKDRKKYKEEKEKLTSKQVEEIKTLKKQQDQMLADAKTQHNDEIQQLKIQVKTAEEQRMQEGGDWTTELQNTLHREQELVRKMAFMDDEKSTLLSQIETLQSQQERVESRLDSVSQTADNAMMREREAEDKLDMTLSMHARQLSQRQTRETLLERTIADLSASLATSSSAQGNTEGDSAAGGGNVAALKNQVYTLEEDLETAKTQLESERQRVSIMQQELREMSKERTLEITASRSKQHQVDRQSSDMSLQISKLQSSLREAQRGSVSLERASGGVDPSTHVKQLTQELVRHQEKMGQVTSEVSALRNRLQVASARAEKAENALSQVGMRDVESAPDSGNYGRGGMRRRKKDVASIRAAINLHASPNENMERVGKVIDGLDKFSVDTGKFLRHNPLARGGFILYLLLLHMWTFVVLFLHTHRFETVHGDFGAGQQFAHGPHALMQYHDPDIFKPIVAEKVQAAPVVKQEVVAVAAAGKSELQANKGAEGLKLDEEHPHPDDEDQDEVDTEETHA